MGVAAMIGFAVLALISITMGLEFMGDSIVVLLVFAVPAGIFVFRIVTGLKDNAAYPARFAEYSRMWYCHKCGTVSVI